MAKLFGLVLALGAGLPLGKEGPFVHISCCIVEALVHLPCFEPICRSKPLRLQMLAVGCAVGVSSTFGAPIGGVLFSIEVTASYFIVSLYWQCFLASVCGGVLTRILFSWWSDTREVGIGAMLYADDISTQPTQLFAYVMIGVASGLIGVAFVQLNKVWMTFRQRHSHRWIFRNRYAWSSLLMVLWSTLSCPETPWLGAFMSKGTFESINELFETKLHVPWIVSPSAAVTSAGRARGVRWSCEQEPVSQSREPRNKPTEPQPSFLPRRLVFRLGERANRRERFPVPPHLRRTPLPCSHLGHHPPSPMRRLCACVGDRRWRRSDRRRGDATVASGVRGGGAARGICSPRRREYGGRGHADNFVSDPHL